MKTYPWKRFWYPSNAKISLADNGFLCDPDGEFGTILNPATVSLAAYADVPCLVLLGEPGAGKSTELHSEFERHRSMATDEVYFWRDLKDYQTDVSLIADVFGGEEFDGWKRGTNRLYLYLDSLDEGRLEIRNIASVLSRQFRSLKPYSRRLFIRIGCRTVDWPITLQVSLEDLWGDQDCHKLELAPLRRVDVEVASQAEGIDANAFLAAVATAECESFASIPITLRMLLGIYREDGKLPGSKGTIFESGCLFLSNEPSSSRRDARQLGNLSAMQRLEVASRLAAAIVFSGRNSISTNVHDVPENTVPWNDLLGGTESVGEESFLVDEATLREVVDTGLFRGNAPSCVGVTHKSIADYLAARYLANKKLDTAQMKSLLFHGDCEEKIVPQLAETVAWLASWDTSLVNLLLEFDPSVLLRSDLSNEDESLRQRLVDRLIRGLTSEELDDAYWVRWQYSSLRHSGLACQLQGVIRDTSQSRMVRRFACSVAGACQEHKLAEDLFGVVQDIGDDHHIRSRAVAALVQCAEEFDLRRLRPLAIGEVDDPEDELKGVSLQALWENRILSAEEVFSCLSEPKDPDFFGWYQLFLSQLPDTLRDEDVLAGLAWLKTQEVRRGVRNEFEKLSQEILRRSLERSSDVEIQAGIVRFAGSRIAIDEEIGFGHADLPDDDIRKSIIAGVVAEYQKSGRRETFRLIHGLAPLLKPHEIGWVLEQSCNAQDDHCKELWAIVAKDSYVFNDPLGWLEAVVSACKRNEIAKSVFAEQISSVEINSARAEELRKAHCEREERQRQMEDFRKSRIIDPPPSDQIANSLANAKANCCENWFELDHALQLEEDNESYWLSWSDDIKAFPGWKSCNEDQRSTIVALAKEFVLSWNPNAGDLKEGRVNCSAYRALALATREEPCFPGSLSSSQWSGLVPTVLNFPKYKLDEGGFDLQRTLIQSMYTASPEQVLSELSESINRECARKDLSQLSVLRRFNCWDAKIEAVLLEKAKTASNARCTCELLEFLILRDSPTANEYAKSLVEGRKSGVTGDLAREAAVVLWLSAKDRGWDILWPAFAGDREFFRETMESLDWRVARPGQIMLTESQLAELYLLMVDEYPYSADTSRKRGRNLGNKDLVERMRDQALNSLQERGTFEAVDECKRIRDLRPDLTFLDWTVREAERNALKSNWQPVSPRQLLELVQSSQARLIRNERDLQLVIIESLQRLQERLRGENPAVRDLWDKQSESWQPVDENDFSDYIVRHLRTDLEKCGIIALREVEIRRGNVDEGERTDIYVGAFLRGVSQIVRVIIEVKGCWHEKLKTAMDGQLKQRYLKENDCRHGIYLVGWFLCDSWNRADSRYAKSPKSWSLDRAVDFFRQQANQLSDNVVLEAFTLDTSLK